jgi:hypothetical protein
MVKIERRAGKALSINLKYQALKVPGEDQDGVFGKTREESENLLKGSTSYVPGISRSFLS